MKKTGILLLTLMLASLVLSGCKVDDNSIKVDQKNFPDKELYNAAISKDLDHDSKLSRSEIESATSINLFLAKDLTGLDVFTNLETIYLRDCKDIKYDFKRFTNLSTLSISGTCESDRIDLRDNTKLEKLYIDCANLKYLALPKGAPLKDILIENTLLEDIYLNDYKGLQKIRIEGNALITKIDFQDFPELAKLTCSSNNKLYNLNLSNCPKLKVFECASNALPALNTSGCENIEELNCSDNRSLTSLDLSAFPKLTALDCSKNYITELDISCCPELTELVCVYNSLTSLDLSSNLKLKRLTCGGNPFKEFDVSCCTNLELLSCWGCQLTSLNFKGCSNLGQLYCLDNKLTSLDLSACPKLHTLSCENNKLTSLDLSVCPKLSGLYCANNSLTSLDISKCPELVYLANKRMNPNVSKDGKSISYHDDEHGHLSIDRGIELVTS